VEAVGLAITFDRQVELGDRDRGSQADVRQVARVAVDVSLPHLDRPFEYLVPESLDEAPGRQSGHPWCK